MANTGFFQPDFLFFALLFVGGQWLYWLGFNFVFFNKDILPGNSLERFLKRQRFSLLGILSGVIGGCVLLPVGVAGLKNAGCSTRCQLTIWGFSALCQTALCFIWWFRKTRRIRKQTQNNVHTP